MLKAPPARIDIKFLEQYPEFIEFRTPKTEDQFGLFRGSVSCRTSRSSGPLARLYSPQLDTRVRFAQYSPSFRERGPTLTAGAGRGQRGGRRPDHRAPSKSKLSPGQLARVFIRRGDPGRVMTDCGGAETKVPGDRVSGNPRFLMSAVR